MTQPDEIRDAVAGHYAGIAVTGRSCCSASTPATGPACCPDDASGYDPTELAGLPGPAVMGLGCGNPVARAAIVEGETVLDLGSGGGIDALLAARRTGPTGRVIGVDMTPEMVARAETNAALAGVDNVEFRPGLIEQLPVGDGTVDVVISNCVINLAPDKAAVFSEAFRVLRPGGRVVISDIVRRGPAPAVIDPQAWASCLDGALPLGEYLGIMDAAGFTGIEVDDQGGEGELFSATFRALRP